MNHIIADRKLGKAADFLPLIIVLFPLFLVSLISEHIPFGDNHKLNQGILKALMKLPIGHKDFSRTHRPPCILWAECAELIFPQIPGQPAGSGSGCREEYHPIAFFFPPEQILNEKLKTILIRIHILSCDTVLFLSGHAGKPLIQSGHKHGIRKLGFRQRFLCRKQDIRLAREQISALQPVAHTLPKFHFYSLRFFLKSLRLIQKHSQAVFLSGSRLSHIIKKGNGVFIKIPDISIQILGGKTLPQRFA